MDDTQLTPGQKMMRVDLAISQQVEVADVKERYAKIADQLMNFRSEGVEDSKEYDRLMTQALNHLEISAALAVKALTCTGFPTATEKKKK